MHENQKPAAADGCIKVASPPGLSEQDQHHLAQLEKLFQLLRDRTASVVRGLTTGLLVHGSGGIGKSYTILDELNRRKANYKVFNSRMTGRGLFDALKSFPDAIHVLEDMEQITHDRNAQGVLRSALWAQRRDGDTGPMERPVTWTAHRTGLSFIFSGGIVMTANRPLDDVPELNGAKTRIAVVHHQASDPQIRALMRSVSLRGYEHDGRTLPPEICSEICEYVIDQSVALHRSLDMRVLVNSFQDFLLWDDGESGCHWRDLVASRLRERPTTFREEVAVGSRAAQKQKEMEIAREIAAATPDRQERLRLWAKRVGKSEPALYRRLKDLGQT